MEPQVTTNENQASFQPKEGQQLLFDLENLVKSHLTGTKELQTEARKYKEMLEDILNNSQEFVEASNVVKEATKKRLQIKNEILKQAHPKELSEKVKELQGEIKDKRGAVSDYAREYYMVSDGVNEIQGEDGEIYEIRLEGKLIKKSNS